MTIVGSTARRLSVKSDEWSTKPMRGLGFGEYPRVRRCDVQFFRIPVYSDKSATNDC